MERFKVGVIGSGFMGAAHIEALRRIPGIDVVAISSIDMPRAEELADQFAIPHIYDDWRAFLDIDGLTAIHNTTPNNLHYEINKAFMEKGVHVLSEKPLTMNSEESAELLKLAADKEVVTGINFNYRFYPIIQHAHGMVKRGEIGEVFIVHGHYIQDWLLYDTDYNWRIEPEVSGDSRCVADIGSHWCDLVQFITGRKIKSVCADLFIFHETRKKPLQEFESFKGLEADKPIEYDEVPIITEDGGNVLIQFEGGARGTFTVSQISAGRKNHEWFEIDGSKAAISWCQEEPNQLWIGHRRQPNEVLIKDPSLLDDVARTYAHYPGGHPEGYPDGPKNLFRNFYRYIRKGKKPGKDPADFPTFVEGDLEVRIVEAILESHKRRAWVDI